MEVVRASSKGDPEVGVAGRVCCLEKAVRESWKKQISIPGLTKTVSIIMTVFLTSLTSERCPFRPGYRFTRCYAQGWTSTL